MKNKDFEQVLANYYFELAPSPNGLAQLAGIGFVIGVATILLCVSLASLPAESPRISIGAAHTLSEVRIKR